MSGTTMKDEAMRLTIVSRDVAINDVMRDVLERRTHFTLGRFGGAIRSVRIGLHDENGPRGGIDKCCRVLVQPYRGEPIVVEGRGAEVRALFDQTLQRTGRTLTRAMQRSAKHPAGRRREASLSG